jgi:hypothetical protein
MLGVLSIMHQEDAMRRGPGGIIGIIIAVVLIFLVLRLIGLI